MQNAALTGHSPIRVLCLIDGLDRGAAELLVVGQVKARDASAIAYTVAYLDPDRAALVGELEALGVPVQCLGRTDAVGPGWFGRLRKLVRGGSFAVIHAHSPTTAIGARMASRLTRRADRPRVVTTEHRLRQAQPVLTRSVDRLTMPLDDAHLAVSSAVRDSLPSSLQLRTEVIRHGIDVGAVVAHRGDRDEVRAALGVSDRLVVGTVATMHLAQGWPDLMAAARRVIDANDRVTFVAVGDGPMREEVQRLHQHLGLGARFVLLGDRREAVRIMAGFDIFALAANSDTLPATLVEAMALGLPIVATDVGGVRELVADGVHGTLVPLHRPDALGDALVAMVSNEQRRTTIATAVRLKGDVLSDQRAFRRIDAVYESLARR